jgi:hypothetical protein
MQNDEPVLDEHGQKQKVLKEARTSIWSPLGDSLPRQYQAEPSQGESPTSSKVVPKASPVKHQTEHDRVVAGGER